MADYKRIVADFHKAMFEQHDAEAIAGLYTENALYVDPSFEIKGREAIKEAYQGFLQAFPDMSAEVLRSFGADDLFASEIRVTGSHTGPLEISPGNVIPETGKRFEMNVCWIGRLDADGLIVEDHTYYDVYGWMRQLGVIEEEMMDESAAA